ncbi:LOW QUALITY PROTEIN: ATP-binding cassette sub-family C member 4-like [Megaptera novaeangliae]
MTFAAWRGVDADGAAAGAPLQVPAERRRPGLQTPRQRRQDAAGVLGGAAQPAAGREPLLPPVLLNFLLLDEISQCNPQLPSDGKTIVDVQDFTAFWDEESFQSKQKTHRVCSQEVVNTAHPVQPLYRRLKRSPCPLVPWSSVHMGLPPACARVVNVQPCAGAKDTDVSKTQMPLPSRGNQVLGRDRYTGRLSQPSVSSLLSAVLGELPPSQGLVNVHGRIAYVSQQPWVFSGAVRSNTLFGKKYEKERYEKVIKACALKKDLEVLEDGDLTVIGDRGTTLSGGQKARVNLARAVYQDADVYLLDDPLSAVDAEVSRHLFELCICQALHEKITILVTHQLQYLKDASQILVLKDGKIVQKGTYATFPKSGVDFEDILLKKVNEQAELSPVPGTPTLRNQTSESSVWSQQSSRPSLQDGAPEDQDTENIQVTLALESCSEGRVHFKTYVNYFTSDAHWLIIIFLILVNIAAQVAYVLQDWWLSYWVNGQSTLYAMVYGKGNLIVVPYPDWYFTVYSVLTVGTVLFGITRSLLIFCVLVNSSQIRHNKMLESILRVPVLFFDTNPIGRILNRFSKDTGHMDDLLPLTFLDFIQTFLLVMGVMVHAAGVMVAVIPWTVIPLVPLGIIFFVLRQYFLETSGDVKRHLECATRSLVFSHLASSLRGLWTIRANNAEQKFQEVFDTHQGLYSEAWLLLLTTSRWLAVHLDVIYAVLVTVVAFVSLILAETLDAGRVGLALSVALTLMGMTQWCIRQSVKVENMMISVERVIEYTDLEKEAPWKYFFHRLPPAWPHEGKIFFQNINLRYSLDGPLVLKDLTAVINSREKVGIVGRTGAGTSSLIAALFRLLEPEISIDGILTTVIGFHHLRKKMSVVPQEPVLFTGTMRKNLDPFNEHMDEELWNALEEVQFKEAIKGVPGKMDTELAESGSNFSAGQRQLVCLARAILRKNQILIIDKATSNVDPRTVELMQKIHEKFVQCTVLTITNRLTTIIDSDRIMVLDSGRLEEYDKPYDLLQDRDGLFYKMVQQLGKDEAAALIETGEQVSLPQGVVIKVRLQDLLFTRSPPGVW